ncbi:regulatory iron-sulfur-containing complex subunit RicT [Mucilaginibacter antarcticus]|uniref:regulatory iron-sulfur-containing complex subunit RicT n=1 Tax=Mucilaginibacter antarcticus TaxID=1855725 RepID=UPI003642B87E
MWKLFNGGGCSPAGCKSNGSCQTGGCSKLDVYDWLSHMDLPVNYKPFSIIEIKFKGSRKEFYQNIDNVYLENGDLVVVEAATGGYDIGHVSLTGELVRMQMTKRRVKEEDVLKKIYRRATAADVDKWKAAKDMEWETMHSARKLALSLNLSMKLSDVDYQADKSKATFYYTAEGRVDFRELIKKMAENFRIRIEMRQIGMRQEASRLGGIGSCGRELCCSTWLTDFKTVSTSAARYQNLSLNTLKLAGQCGKLKCCLNYELDTYMDALKHIPDNVNYLKTGRGDARLQKTDIFKKQMWFSFAGEEAWIPVPLARVKEVQQMNRDGVLPDDLVEFVELEEEIEKAPDYENVVGQDSLTRLDDRNKNKKSRNGNTRSKPNPNNPNGGTSNNNQPRQADAGGQPNAGGRQQQRPRPEGGNQQRPQSARPEGSNQRPQGPRPEGGSGNNPQRQQGPRPEGAANPQQQRPQGPRPEGSAGNSRNRNNRNRNRNRGEGNRGGAGGEGIGGEGGGGSQQTPPTA